MYAGRLTIRGRAPDGLLYELGVESFGSGDLKLAKRRGAARVAERRLTRVV